MADDQPESARRGFLRGAGLTLAGATGFAFLDATAAAEGPAEDAAGRLLSGADWSEFCKKLNDAAALLTQAGAPRDGFNQAEGYRYLTRLLRGAIWSAIEAADPDFPSFISTTTEMVKIGADNPDNIYLSATVKGEYDYRVHGKRGTIFYLSIESKESRYGKDGTMLQTGELDVSTLTAGPDGTVEIIASATPKLGQHWLPMAPGTNSILIRQSFLDRQTEIPGSWRIERIGGPAKPAPLDPAFFERALMQAANFVYGTAKTFADWTRRFVPQPNELPDWGQDWMQKAGGDPAIFYLHGYWKLAADEAWIIHTKVPEAPYWNFQLDNWWMESMDYLHLNVTLNKKTARLNPDGSLTIVVAAADPGVPNWIETAGHTEGTALLRWVRAQEHPLPRCKVVKLAEAKHHLTAE